MSREENKSGIVIMIANQKGGCGKTTITHTLCDILGRYGYKVLGIDMDGQTHFSMYAGAVSAGEMSQADEKSPTICRALLGECRIEECIEKKEHFDIARGDKRMDFAQRVFLEADDQYRLLDAVEIIRRDMDYDFILVDCPPQRGIVQEMAMVAADYCLIPSFVDYGSISGVINLGKDIVAKKKRNLSHAEILGIIYGRYRYTKSDKDSVGELAAIAEKMGTSLFDICIRDSIAVPDSQKNNQTIQEYQPKGKAAADYRFICCQMLERMGIENKKMKRDVKRDMKQNA
jgi:ATPases involved in chromosome partitioning